MKERVVRSRHGPPQARLRWAARFLGGKMWGLPQQVLLQAHEVYSDSDALGKRTYTQSASSPTIPRTEARTISRMSASVFASTSSCSGVTHTQTAGSSVASSPTSTRHDATGVGRPCSFPSSDSILVVVFVTTSVYRTHPNAVHAPHWPRSQQLGDGGPAFIREAPCRHARSGHDHASPASLDAQHGPSHTTFKMEIRS